MSKLQVRASGDRDIVMTREFDAPRDLVFEAHTKPELVQRWLTGPPPWVMTTCEIDLRVGGTYRYVWTHPDNGNAMGMGGTYREIVAPERIVACERFDDPWYPGEAVSTLQLTEKNGRTLLTNTVTYVSKEARDGVLASPMESGVAISYDQLEQLVTSTKA